jgi:putative ABC transport system ATP-binding protein/lipoprotein-releasing system ATP-binding protein
MIIRDIKKSFGQPPTEVLKGISCEIKTGELVSITGRSGSGKSTLLYIISSLDRPTQGEVLVDNQSLFSMSQKELHDFRNQKMGFVFQFHYLLPELTALENVLMPLRKINMHIERRDSGIELLKEFGIHDKANHFPSQLSGGEQQRVAIARALVTNPTYIFADEPTGNLDSINGQAVMNLFIKINKERNTTILFVTHDAEFAKLARRQIHLVDGSLRDISFT